MIDGDAERALLVVAEVIDHRRLDRATVSAREFDTLAAPVVLMLPAFEPPRSGLPVASLGRLRNIPEEALLGISFGLLYGFGKRRVEEPRVERVRVDLGGGGGGATGVADAESTEDGLLTFGTALRSSSHQIAA